jgi:hypothetical protein
MRQATDTPHPYLLNRAGGITKVKEFSLVGGALEIVLEDEKPATGPYHLVYRCPEHAASDIKRAVHCNGASWAVVDKAAPEDDCDVCYPPPCN